MVLPALPAPLLDAAPLPDPKPLVFGLVAVLQNVAVISSWQMMPGSVSGELFIVPAAPSACCCDCAPAGDAAKSSAETTATFVISATPFLPRALKLTSSACSSTSGQTYSGVSSSSMTNK
jgi:hypothetical protein